MGVSNIILDTKASLSLEKLIETSYHSYQGKVQLELPLDQVKKEVTAFFKHRIRGILDEQDFSYDTIDAVLSAGYDDLNDTLLRAKALAEFRQEADFADLLTAFVRANNLSKKAAVRRVNPDLLADPAEKELYRLLAAVQEKAGDYLEQQNYRSLFSAIATLQGPLDEFFTSVLVMVDEEPLRNNRLALLANLAALVKQAADLTKVVVSD
ncbi:MAG: glycine--tRNA ligase subunit beta [Candidatus Syntrophopropionicum ammoniitolerans]